jgi:hypothetical protein
VQRTGGNQKFIRKVTILQQMHGRIAPRRVPIGSAKAANQQNF